MKEVIKYMAARLSRIAAATAIVAAVTVPALAARAASADVCVFGGQFMRQIVVSGGRAVATFEIPNGIHDSCNRSLTYSLVAYTAPDSTLRPLSSQVLFSSSIKNFTPGTHTMSTAMPTCGFFQVDLVKGLPIVHLNDAGNSYAPQGRLITAIGSGSACPTPQPTPPPTPTPTPPATPSVTNNNVNNNTNVNNNVNMQSQSQSVVVNPAAPPVTETTTTTPATTSTVEESAAPSKQLVNTGPGSVAALFVGASTVSGLAYNLFMRRRLSH